ncbi:MAG: hypothetical protein JXR22_01460 [Prolixibacteraceae bacterium]|nr:hypothetical protein [Prolixibacteraceae bacterium]
MTIRKGLLIFLLLIAGYTSHAQFGLNFKAGVAPWHFSDQFNDLSNPISLGYSAGLNVEQVLFRSSVGLVSGLEYLYSPPGIKYTDMSDQENILAVIYESEVNQHFIQVSHHEFSIPLQLVFYHNGLRTGIGASYSRYFFEKSDRPGEFNSYDDYGLVACTGARLTKRLIFSVGYYYGLKDIIDLNAVPANADEAGKLQANMQQFRIHLAFSLFNNLRDSKYFISE